MQMLVIFSDSVCTRCVKHGRKCTRSMVIDESMMPQGSRAVNMCVAGSACVDYSAYGNHQQAAGKTALFLIVLLRLILEDKPLLFLHENVLGFPLALLMDVLAELYEIEEIVITPEIANFPVERRRKYALGRFRLSLRTF